MLLWVWTALFSSTAVYAQSVSQLIDEISGDRPLSGRELFQVELPEAEEDRQVEILLQSGESEILLAAYSVDGQAATLSIGEEELWGPDPGRLPEGRVLTRVRTISGEVVNLPTIQNWNQKPWYPQGDTRGEILDRVSRNLRDGYPVKAYRELSGFQRNSRNREEEAEWYRLNASILDVFSKIDRVHRPRVLRDRQRAIDLAPEDSSSHVQSLIDRARSERLESRSGTDAGERRKALIRSLEDARKALEVATDAGERSLAASALVEIAQTAAARGWMTETRTAVAAARELNGDLETLWKTEVALATVHQSRGEIDLAIERARSAVEAVEQIRLRHPSDAAAMFQRREAAFLLTELLAISGETLASLQASEFLRVRNPGESIPGLQQLESLAVESGDRYSIQVLVDTGNQLLNWVTVDGVWELSMSSYEPGELQFHIDRLHASRGRNLDSASWISGKVFATQVPVTERLLLLPLDDLRRVPWGMLPVGGRSLIDRTTCSLLPNLKAASRELSALPSEGWLSLVDPDAPGKVRLPGARAEGDQVSLKLGGSTVLSGTAATVNALSAGLPGKRLLHLGCHGDFDPRDPESSSLSLSPDAEHADGRLKARNLAGWNLSDCRLVLLTGCETAMAGGPGADDLAGFPRAVLAAGCQGILGSLWPVEDEVTRQLTLHLIDSAAARISPAEALRDACRSIREKSESGQVSGWSGWVLVENAR